MHAALISRAPHPRLACRPPCPAAGQVLALYSSKGYAVGIKAQKWMLAEEHVKVKTDELSDELGSTQQARRRRHDLVRQPALGFRRHGPLPHYVERLPGRPLVLRARQEPEHEPRRGLRGGRGGAGCGRGKEEADLLELEAADAVARLQGMGV